MRLLAIGDIHGCLLALDTLLAQVNPRPGDQLVSLGDYTDRGPDSKGVLDRLIGLHAKGLLIPLRGNHDELMLQAREGLERRLWLSCGGRATLKSYGVADADAEEYAEIPESHWRFLEVDCRDYHESDTHFFVHGNADPDKDLADQATDVLYWEKLFEIECRPHRSGKIMVCGHTKQLTGKPLNLGHVVCIDTGVYESNGWLTCLDPATGEYWQANQRGQHRIGRLEKPCN
jgi:serine/threonine protein phosphatase 1